MTKCPRCVQGIYRAAVECPHCGFAMKDVDALFGQEGVRLSVLSDAAGVLKAQERKDLRLLIEKFERRFPQLIFAVYIASFEQTSHVREFGFWLLNRATFFDASGTRANEGGLLLTIDITGKVAGLTYGYLLQPHWNEDDSFAVLSASHPFFLQGQYFEGVEVGLSKLETILARRSTKLKKGLSSPESPEENKENSPVDESEEEMKKEVQG